MTHHLNEDPILYFSGIDGDTGSYLLPPCPPEALASLLARWRNPEFPRRVAHGVDPDDLEQTGWGIVWPPGGAPERRRALAPLLELRRRQTGGHLHEFELLEEEKPLEFLERHGVGPGPVDAEHFPYYLLLAGDPEQIPFDFQSELGSSHAVARLDLDHPDHDAAYAEGVVRYEDDPSKARHRAAFFGVEHRDDPATWTSAEHLAAGLEARLARNHRGWDFATYLRHAARKEHLHGLLHGGTPPALLFTAGHGVRYRKGSRLQPTLQGALLCAEYPGPKVWDGRPLDAEQLFAAPDLAPDLDLAGLVSCHFACYSAGTPRSDRYDLDTPKELAERAFVSPLPKALLRRGALAVIGHVDITLEGTFLWHDAGPQLSTFGSLLGALLDGHRLGYAMEFLASRSNQLAMGLTSRIRQGLREEGPAADLKTLRHWAAFEDARNFIALGDPAVRLHP